MQSTGGGHPTKLTFGDVFNYTRAKVCGLPPLLKGFVFSRADIACAVTR